MASEKFLILLISLFVFMMVCIIGFSEWGKMNCRIGLGQAGKPALEIMEICK